MVIVIIGLLIISPWIRTTVNRQKKPWLVIAADNSVSMPPATGKEKFLSARKDLRDDLVKSLGDLFQVKEVHFGAQTADGFVGDFTDPVTDPGEFFEYLRVFARTHEMGGVLMNTDGVSTRGVTFDEAARNFPYPVSVLASGDSTRFPDVRIQEVVCNEWVRRNSTFPVRVYFNAGDYKGSSLKIRISGPKGVIERNVETTGQAPPYAEFQMESPDKGVMQMIATIVPETPDKNQDNNSKSFTVSVIEKEGEILCLYESPHPDIDAIVQALKGANTVKLTVIGAADYTSSDKRYDLVILHGLPSLKHPVHDLLVQTASSRIPILFIIGGTTDPDLFNQMKIGMIVGARRRAPEASRGILNPAFTLFNLPSDFGGHLATWPPLDLSFETYLPDPGSEILFKQKILNIELADPLTAFANARGTKYGFVCGEGIWLWRLHEFLEQKNHDYFDDWLSHLIQYLMTDDKNDRFKVIIPEELYAYTPVRITGHLLNNSLEAVNIPDVLFTVTNPAGEKTEYQMGRVGDYYELVINGFSPGTYRYEAQTKLGEENFKRDGVMNMMTRPIEQNAPVADFASLRFIAENTGGRFFLPGGEGEMITWLKGLKPSELKFRKEFKWYDLINFKWLLPFLVLLLAVEWFLRRWFGIL
jgi:hypothetical protein